MAVQVCRVTETNPVDWSASVVSSHHRSSGRTSFIRVSASLTSPVPTPRLRHFSSTDRRCSRSATHSWKRTNQPPRCRLQVRRCGWTTIIPPARPPGRPSTSARSMPPLPVINRDWNRAASAGKSLQGCWHGALRRGAGPCLVSRGPPALPGWLIRDERVDQLVDARRVFEIKRVAGACHRVRLRPASFCDPDVRGCGRDRVVFAIDDLDA